MSRDSLKGNAPVTMVTSFPESGNETSRWSLLVQPSGVQFRFWRNCRGRCIINCLSSSSYCMLRDNWPVIDWREPIGLQERLEGRSSHNGEISVMSRSRFQGTEGYHSNRSVFRVGLVGLVTLYISDERWAEIALRDWEIASLSQSVELRQAASSK